MDLLENPFYILSASPGDNRRRIMELADERSLLGDPDKCAEACAELTNPRRRLSAETGWLLGVSPKQTEEMFVLLESAPLDLFKVENLSKIARINLLSAALIRLPQYNCDELVRWVLEIAKEFDGIEPKELCALISEERAASGFPKISNLSDIEDEIKERREYYRKVFDIALDKLPSAELIKTVTKVIDSNTHTGEFQAYTLIYDLVDSYEVKAQGFLDKEEKNIKVIIDRLLDAVSSKQPDSQSALIMEQLIKTVKNWDAVAQPIQVSAMSRGSKHQASVDIGHLLRDLSIRLYNDYGKIEFSMQITNMLQEVFAEVGEIVERATEDAKILKEEALTNQANQLLDETYECIRYQPASGYDKAKKVLRRAPELITKMKAANIESHVIGKYRDSIAVLLKSCAVAYGNKTKDWNNCKRLLVEALKYAISKDVFANIEENISNVNIININEKSNVFHRASSYSDGSRNNFSVWIVIGIIAFLTILIGMAVNENRSYPADVYVSQPSSNSLSRSTSIPTQTPSQSERNEDNDFSDDLMYQLKARSVSPDFYVSPPTGTGNILSISEIRWCVRQDIRLNALRDNISTEKGIDQFNNLVADFNSRCSNYRYREGTQQRAEREVSALRKQIEEEVIAIFKAFEDSVRRNQAQRTKSKTGGF